MSSLLLKLVGHPMGMGSFCVWLLCIEERHVVAAEWAAEVVNDLQVDRGVGVDKADVSTERLGEVQADNGWVLEVQKTGAVVNYAANGGCGHKGS